MGYDQAFYSWGLYFCLTEVLGNNWTNSTLNKGHSTLTPTVQVSQQTSYIKHSPSSSHPASYTHVTVGRNSSRSSHSSVYAVFLLRNCFWAHTHISYSKNCKHNFYVVTFLVYIKALTCFLVLEAWTILQRGSTVCFSDHDNDSTHQVDQVFSCTIMSMLIFSCLTPHYSSSLTRPLSLGPLPSLFLKGSWHNADHDYISNLMEIPWQQERE